MLVGEQEAQLIKQLIKKIDMKLAKIEEELKSERIKAQVKEDIEEAIWNCILREGIGTKIKKLFLGIFGRKADKVGEDVTVLYKKLWKRAEEVNYFRRLEITRKKALTKAKDELIGIKSILSS